MGWTGKPHMPRREAISGPGAASEDETSKYENSCVLSALEASDRLHPSHSP